MQSASRVPVKMRARLWCVGLVISGCATFGVPRTGAFRQAVSPAGMTSAVIAGTPRFGDDPGNARSQSSPVETTRVRFAADVPPRNDIAIDNLVPIRMRDGVTLYADVYRPDR